MSESNNQNSPGGNSGNSGNSQGGGQNRHRHHRPRHRRGGFNRGPNPNHPNQPRNESEGQAGAEGAVARPQQNAQGQGFHRRPDHNSQNGQNPRSNDQRRHHSGGQQQQNRHPNPNNRFHQGQGQGGQRPRPHHHQQHGHGPRDPRPKTGVDAIYDKYENLMTEHLNARKKYFDLFYKADHNQRRKLEDNFNRTLEAVRRWEETLETWKKEFFVKKVEMYRFDTTYSENRSLITDNTLKPSYGIYPGLGDNPPEAPFEDPHFLKTQAESFSEDKEESVGTIDDYKKLKGLM